MKIAISTHQGSLYNDIVDYVVVSAQDGEFAILKDHAPIISVIDDGDVKLVLNENEAFVALRASVLEFHDNVLSILAQEAHIGSTAKSAKEHLDELRKSRLETNRKESADFTQMEKELRESLKKSRAGSL